MKHEPIKLLLGPWQYCLSLFNPWLHPHRASLGRSFAIAMSATSTRPFPPIFFASATMPPTITCGQSILHLLHEQQPYTEFERLVQKLITGHESWAALPTIFLFLHRHRQDWLEPFLSKSKFRMKVVSPSNWSAAGSPDAWRFLFLAGQRSLPSGFRSAPVPAGLMERSEPRFRMRSRAVA